MNFSTSPSWIAAGIILLILATYALIHLWKGQGDEVPDPEVEYIHYTEPEEEVYNPEAIYPIAEPDILKLEKYEKVYNHFEFEKRYGLSFKDYLRKVEANQMNDFEPTVTRSLDAHLS